MTLTNHMEQARRGDVMKDAGILAVRAVAGALLAGHGAQKLFGVFGGPGLRGTAGFMEMLGLRPGHLWGTAAALSEFGGGTLLALGLLSPLGSIGAISAMTMATVKAHWGKPIWVSKGGAELAVTYGTIALAVGLTGPGAYSLDHALGVRVPKPLAAGAALTAATLVGLGIAGRPARTPAAQPEQGAPASAGGDGVRAASESTEVTGQAS
jgi:putative oxidoreductase